MSLELFAKFKEKYPNHGAAYNVGYIPWYRAALGNFRQVNKSTRRTVEPTKMALYASWVSGRGITPGKPTKALKSRLEAILAAFPGTTRIWVQGSRAVGDWVDKKTPKDKLELRFEVTGKDKPISDWDFYIEPVQDANFDDIHIMNFKASEAIQVYGEVQFSGSSKKDASQCDSCFQRK